jgi:hypothetical protein
MARKLPGLFRRIFVTWWPKCRISGGRTSGVASSSQCHGGVRYARGVFGTFAVVALLCHLTAETADAQSLPSQERLCDPVFQDCRADVLTYIAQETLEIDMGFWMMTDARYANALVAARQRGVKIRLLMDPRCAEAHENCQPQNDQLAAAGIPMRKRLTSGILHWKMALFAAQGQLEFAGANYAPYEMVPDTPYVNYTDEIVYYTNNPSLVNSFKTKFDDLWTSTSEFGNYANVSGPLSRSYPKSAIDPELNFPPDDSYRTRAINAYAAEGRKIDVQMFRITDESHTNAMLSAIGRGVPVRLITDETEYRNPDRLWDAYNVDRMYAGGVQVRFDGHQGIDHEKAVILYGTQMSIFGSSNWTSPSSDSQREHNAFTTKGAIFTWLVNQFERKWNNQTGYAETKPFVPLPPDAPSYVSPANGAAGTATTGLALTWYAGPWGQVYDVYFGTASNPPLLEADKRLGPSQSSADYKTYALPALQTGTRYYWKIVARTMAGVAADGPIWTFVTSGPAAPRTAIAGDADGDGRSDLMIFRKSTGTWYSLLSSANYGSGQAVAWGTNSDIPVAGDFDGDHVVDRACFRPSNGTWYILESSTGFTSGLTVQWGTNGDVPLQADLDGDGRSDLVVWRPSNGTFYWLTSSSGYTTGQQKQWGSQSYGDTPLLADMDGDKKADLIVWRASTGVWYWLTSSSGYNYSAAWARQWGTQTYNDIPLAGDLDGDGRADLVIWRPGSGMWYWLKSSTGYDPNRQGLKQWGTSGDVPLLLDFDADGVRDLVVWRPGNGVWFWLTSSTGYGYGSARQQQWGSAAQGDIPVTK